MSKIIFLDIDGVLVTWDSISTSSSGLRADFCQKSVDNLNKLTAETNAEIVVSSTWRLSFDSVDKMQELLNSKGVSCNVVGLTPKVPSRSRAEEIATFLMEEKNIHYVIIDDDGSVENYPSLSSRFVMTSLSDGFGDSSLEEAIELFKKCDGEHCCKCSSGKGIIYG